MSTEQYYLSTNAYAYPSSNANDGGEDNSEYNLKTITDKFAIKGFVVRRTGKWEGYFIPKYHTDDNGVGVSLTPGECSINGYYFNLGDIVVYTSSEGKSLLLPSTKYVVAFRVYKDGVGNIRGDGYPLVGVNKGQLECRGIVVGFYTESELEDLDKELTLPIGDFTTDRDGNPPTSDEDYHLWENRFMFIDADTIIVSETGQNIVDWVNSRIDYELSRLDRLQHWSEDDQTLESTLILYSNDLIVDLKDYDSFSILDIEKRTHVAESGKNTEMDLPEEGSDTQYKTYNGVSVLLARADHDHDGRYIVRNAKNLSLQTIKTPLKVEKDFSVGSSFSVSSSDGSFTACAGKFTTDSSGSFSSEGNGQVSGNFTAQGDITGNRVYNAVWNDYADAVLRKPGDTSLPGNIISKCPDSEYYEISSWDTRNLVVGVYSDTFGHLLGGYSGSTIKETLSTHIPLAVSGNVRVRVVGKVKPGDFIVASHIDGVGKSSKFFLRGRVVGKALEGKDSAEGIKRILVQVMLR